jgi:pimeloyl-ACP methyl ester carboxylesterase
MATLVFAEIETTSKGINNMKKKATFVLVHGAWHGGWCWKKVTPLLTSARHTVYTPTLSGLGEHKHLANESINLDTHIQDIVSLLEFEDLNDIILVGHSYAGFVITGVANKVPGRIAKIVYLDAMFPEDGKALIDYLAPEMVRKYNENVKMYKDGWLLPFNETLTLQDFGITDPIDVAWMTPRMTAQPYKTFTQKIQISTTSQQFINERGIYISTSDKPHYISASKRASESGLKLLAIPGAGHGSMVTQPKKLAELLLN